MKNIYIIFIGIISFQVTDLVSISCFNCSSVDDNYCPEFMNPEDEQIIPFVSCNHIFEARFCIKTTGVNGGVWNIYCWRCDDEYDSGGCSDGNLTRARLSNCLDVFESYYCVKTTQGFVGRSLGTTRFCSSRDMGNYCEYIKRPGDHLEYRSCVFTCSSNGCNKAQSLFNFNYILLYILFSIQILLHFY